jgi:Asp-tRNA(Asn)/Glu-tRNA(Gln) amidotransferase A subunit family amidase
VPDTELVAHNQPNRGIPGPCMAAHSALTSVELTEAYLDRIRTVDPKLRPVLFVDPIA